MSENRIRSMPGPVGNRSPRTYTLDEFTAARRLGFAEGKNHSAHGPIFWATGDYYPGLIRQRLDDYELLAKAIEREWKADDE